MSFYSNMATVASRLLASRGQSVTFSRATGATFDPDTGQYSGGSTTTITGNGAAFDYLKSEIDGQIIQSGDVRLLLEATSSAPAQGDKCTLDSVDYRVMNVSPLSPGGTVVTYTVQLRK